jgi:phosphate transport system protein
MQRHFDDELTLLKTDLLIMGAMVEESIFKSIEALKDLNEQEARKIIDDDVLVDEIELRIEEKGLDLLALHQPMAVDLRFISMAMKITNELERIADLSVDIAQRVLELSGKPHLKQLIDIPKLTAVAQEMIKNVISAFINKDADLAGKVILMDTQADSLRDIVQQELINEYMAKDPTTATRAVPLLLVARHLERICDHATNIAEDVIYMCSANVVKHHPEKI